MARIAVGIEYDGSAYAGWQAQEGLPTIQALAGIALSRVADHPVQLTCAGRTDAGVHALGQVAHFDSEAARNMRSWVLGANSELPKDVSLSWAQAVPDHFHARFSAQARTYRYLIVNRLSRPALLATRACWIHKPLDHESMAAAGRALIGEHDFSAFRAAHCQAKSPVRRLTHLSVVRDGERITVEVTANAFLHHMVRNIAGLLICIGKGESPVSRAAEVLAGRDRMVNAATAPAGGLYLAGVRYPNAFALPEPPREVFPA